jgi:DNA topoisomerase-3
VLELQRVEPALKLPPGLQPSDAARVLDVVVHQKQTRPPPHYTDATLLTAMETAGRVLDDQALMAAMRESGLGTPATRAATIETLLDRGYLARAGKTLTSTSTGEALIAAAHPLVKSPEMTGRWELRLRRMERGEEAFEPFMREIADYVSQVVASEAEKPAQPRQPRAYGKPHASKARSYKRRKGRSAAGSGSKSASPRKAWSGKARKGRTAR